MKDFVQVEVTGDADAVTSELYVENTVENRACNTIENNNFSLVSENIENVTKLDTNILDDCMWRSIIEITKDVDNQSNMELPLECQDVIDNNIYLKNGNTSDKIFLCIICGKRFVLNYLLKNHLAIHKRQVNFKTNKCKICGKKFMLKFVLNRHISKHHKSLYRCRSCKLFINCPNYIEHKKFHKRRGQTKFDTIPKIKLCKLNGVWKIINESKCNICFQKDYSENNLVQHLKTDDNCQKQHDDHLDYVPVAELNNHKENIRNRPLFKCQKCNRQFKKKKHLNCHLIQCLRHSQTKSNKVSCKIMVNEKTCSACVFNNSLSLKNHTTFGCKHYTCKYCGQFFNERNCWLKHMVFHKKVEQCANLKTSTDTTSTRREYNKTEVINDSSFNTLRKQFLSGDVTGKNSSDHNRLVNSNSTIVSNSSPNSMANDCHILNINQEKDLYTNVREWNSLDQVDTNESTLENEHRDVMAKQFPINKNNKNCNMNNRVSKSDEKKLKCCIFCNKHFAHLGALTNHMRIHGHTTYKCQYCFMQFSKKGLYIVHEKTHVLKNVVKSAPSLNKNNVVKVNDEPQIEHCNDFEIAHSSIDGNASGTNLTDIEHLWFPCDVCQKTFSTPSQLIFHRKIHYEIVPYVCKICNKSYQMKFRWNYHLKEHYKRNLKSKQHTNNLKLNIHELKIESISPKDQIKCRNCKKGFNSMSRWKSHMSMSKKCRRHRKSNIPEFTSNKTYFNTSDNTGLTKNKLLDIIKQKSAIKKQNRSNHIDSNKCEVCGKIYSSRSNLTRHISMVHAQTSEPITCNICSGTFKHKISYRKHLRTKHEQFYKYLNIMKKQTTYKRTSGQITSVKKNKYICKICKVKFADKITLQKHTKIHTLYNKYKCNDCGQQFETNLSLSNHIWEYHSDNISTSD